MEKNFRPYEKVPHHLRSMAKVLNGKDPLWKDRRARTWCKIFGTKLPVLSFEEMQEMETKRQEKLDELKKKKMEEFLRIQKEADEKKRIEREAISNKQK